MNIETGKHCVIWCNFDEPLYLTRHEKKILIRILLMINMYTISPVQIQILFDSIKTTSRWTGP